MANRPRTIDEKVKPVQIALEQINIEKAAREAGVPPSTLRYDLNKVKQSLADVLKNRTPGPKARVFSPSGGSPTD
jgi:transposase-like protein